MRNKKRLKVYGIVGIAVLASLGSGAIVMSASCLDFGYNKYSLCIPKKYIVDHDAAFLSRFIPKEGLDDDADQVAIFIPAKKAQKMGLMTESIISILLFSERDIGMPESVRKKVISAWRREGDWSDSAFEKEDENLYTIKGGKLGSTVFFKEDPRGETPYKDKEIIRKFITDCAKFSGDDSGNISELECTNYVRNGSSSMSITYSGSLAAEKERVVKKVQDFLFSFRVDRSN